MRSLWFAVLVLTACSSKETLRDLGPLPQAPPERVVEEAEPPPRYIAISDRVEFEVGKAVLLRESLAILDQVVDVMLKNQDIEVVEVEGHTDSTGEIEDNQILSEERAAAVREYLVSRGVAEFRLTARGYGESVPLSTNDSDGGRQTNRRVQFRIIRQTGKP